MRFSVSYILAVVIAINWLICQIQSLDYVTSHLTLIPMQLHVWAMILYVTVEPNLLVALFSILLFLKYGMMLERGMNSRIAYLMYLVLSALWTACSLLVIELTLSAIFGASYRIYYGLWPVLEAILISQCNNDGSAAVGLQKSPRGGVVNDDRVYNLDTGRRESAYTKWSLRKNKFRVHHLPQAVVLLALINDIAYAVVGGRGPAVQKNDGTTSSISTRTHGSSTLSSICGMWLAWAYLRHVRHQIKFSFDVLVYPSSFRRMVWRLGNWCSDVTRSIQSALWSTAGNSKMESVLPVVNNGGVSIENVTLLPGSTAEEAERRRAAALAALSRRLEQVRVSTDETNEV